MDCAKQSELGLCSVTELMQRVVLENRDATAVVFEDRKLNFEALQRLADQFAVALRNMGVAKGEHVGLCMDRCPEAIAAMLGIMRVGAAFVPLDTEYPIDRIQFMIEDAGIEKIVTHDKNSNARLQEIASCISVTWLDSCNIEFAEIEPSQEEVNWEHPAPEDMAYVMYTSGSTGNPKGVQIEHRALTTYCMADIEAYRLTRFDRTLQFSTLNFDIAIEEIFPPLLIGSCVVVRPSQRADSANELSQILSDYDVTAIHLATAYWHEWVDLMQAHGDMVPESLRLVIATGEKVSVAHYRRWQEICQHDVLWCNAYGPTEATVTSTVFFPEQDFDAGNMPIGKALPGYSTLVLDANLSPLDAGETGELFIGGPALARGYLNRPDLTEKAFIEVEIDGMERRLYKTGDLASFLACGNIEFSGRIDHQIKLGSYRIEPGEIESTLSQAPGVLDSLVIYEEVG
ncbi:MAG: amino acid adenylation domain-containing protein, partial [Planctomycetota bacterium]